MLDRAVEGRHRCLAVGRQRQATFIPLHDGLDPELLALAAPSVLRSGERGQSIDGSARGGRLAAARPVIAAASGPDACRSGRAGRGRCRARRRFDPSALRRQASTPHRAARRAAAPRSSASEPEARAGAEETSSPLRGGGRGGAGGGNALLAPSRKGRGTHSSQLISFQPVSSQLSFISAHLPFSSQPMSLFAPHPSHPGPASRQLRSRQHLRANLPMLPLAIGSALPRAVLTTTCRVERLGTATPPSCGLPMAYSPPRADPARGSPACPPDPARRYRHPIPPPARPCADTVP